MRDFIQYLHDNHLADTLDTVNALLCLVLELFVGQWLAKKLNIKRWKALVLTVARFVFALVIQRAIYELHTDGAATGSGFLTMAYFYIPIVLAPIYLLMRIKWRTACDYLAVTLAVFQWPIHIGCIWKSCCNGYETKLGIWNANLGHYTFPIQIVDCIIGLGIALLLIYLLKKNGFKPSGKLYPLLLILHGLDRLLLDFARDTRRDLLGLTYAQFHAMFIILVGAVSLVVLTVMRKNTKKAISTTKSK